MHTPGATPLPQKSRGLNPALEEGRLWATGEGASALLVLPADLPLIEAEDVRGVLAAAKDEPSAVIVPAIAWRRAFLSTFTPYAS